MNKMKSRLTKPNLSEKEKLNLDNFEMKMNSTLLISHSKAVDMIKNDRLRSNAQKEEDLAFLTSMKLDRVGYVGNNDKIYEKRVENKIDRLQEAERRKNESEDLNCNVISATLPEEQEFIDQNADNCEDAEYNDNFRIKKSPRDKTVSIRIPVNIVDILAPTAIRYNVSSTALSSILGQTVQAGGGYIDDLPISVRQVERNVKKSIHNISESAIQSFKEDAKNLLFICHFDGKQLEEFTEGIKVTKERLSVLLSSPSLDHCQLLGAIPLEGQTGEQICAGVMSLLAKIEVTSNVIGMSFDTTASNTGQQQGACARLELALGKALLWLACRRHVMALHIKHVASAVAKQVSGRKSTGPDNVLFNKLKQNWPDLLSKIDLQKLNKLKWDELPGEDVRDQAEFSLQTLMRLSQQKTFPREDYKELCDLAIVYLGGVVPDFRFQYPGALHHARYMAKSIYVLKYALLMDMIDWMTDNEKKEVLILAEFISVFYILWFLQSSVGCLAPMNDLKAILQMKMYSKYNKLVSETCLNSWSRHTWYLSEELVIFCLADPSCPFRDDIAAKLLNREDQNTLRPMKPKLPDVATLSKDTNLAELTGSRSYLLFDLLSSSSSDLEWMKNPSSEWDKFPEFQRFSSFVTNLKVVNDAGERGVKAIQEVVHKSSHENVRQDMLLSNAEDRRKHKNKGTGEATKAKLSKI